MKSQFFIFLAGLIFLSAFNGYTAEKEKVNLAEDQRLLSQIVAAVSHTLSDENKVREATDKVMEKVGQGNFDAAFDELKPYMPLSETTIESAKLQTRSTREQYASRFGESIGYEFIDSEKVGTVLLRIRYLEKTKLGAVPWAFYFYKTNEGWILNTFDWNDRYKDLFSTAAPKS